MNSKTVLAYQKRFELVSYPHRGMIRILDRWGVTLAAWAFGIIAALAVLHAALEGHVDFAVKATLLWVVALLALGGARGIFLMLRETDEDIDTWYRESSWRGVQTIIAFIAAALLVFIIKFAHLSPYLALYVWPIFLPGIITLTQRFTHMDPYFRPNGAFSSLTKWVVFYALASAILIAWLASDPIAWTPVYDMTDNAPNGRGIFNEVLKGLVASLPSLLSISSQLLLYYLLRRLHLSRVLGNFLTQVFEALVQMDDDLQKSWDKVAQLTQELLRYHRVIILAPDDYYRDIVAARSEEEQHALYKQAKFQVLGRAGEGSDALLAAEFPLTEGVAFRCLVEGHFQKIDDVHKIDHYYEAGLKDTRSELQVPIFDPDREGKVLMGIIVAQDVRPGAFQMRDVHTLTRLSSYLASYSRRFDSLWSSRRLQTDLEEIIQLSVDPVIGILHELKRISKSSRVAYVPLGFANAWPIGNRICLLPNGFAEPDFFRKSELTHPDGPLIDMIESWQPKFMNSLALADVSQASKVWQEWAKQESMSALALIPVGSYEQRAGVLVVGFTRLHDGVWSELQTSLTNFAKAIVSYLNIESRDMVYRQKFETQPVNLHSYLSAEDLGHSAIKNLIEQIDHLGRDEVKDIGNRFRRVLLRMYEAGDMSPPNIVSPSLQSSLAHFHDALSEGRHGHIALVWRCDNRLEQESLTIKVILYRFVTEAVLNALNHGHARTVLFRIARLNNRIKVVVADDGDGFELAQNAADDHGTHPNGIFSLGYWFEELCSAAPLNWAWTAPGCGACVHLELPMLPDSSLSMEITHLDQLDNLEVSRDAFRTNCKDPPAQQNTS